MAVFLRWGGEEARSRGRYCSGPKVASKHGLWIPNGGAAQGGPGLGVGLKAGHEPRPSAAPRPAPLPAPPPRPAPLPRSSAAPRPSARSSAAPRPAPPCARLCQRSAHPVFPPGPRAAFRGRHDGGRVLRLRLYCLRACARPLHLHHRHRAVAHHLPHHWVRRLRRKPGPGASLPHRGYRRPRRPQQTARPCWAFGGRRVERERERRDPAPWDSPSSEGRLEKNGSPATPEGRLRGGSSHCGSQKTLMLVS